MIKWHQCRLMWTFAKFRRSLTFPLLGEEVGFFFIYTSKNRQSTQKKLVLEKFFYQTNSKNTILYICIANRKRRVRKALNTVV